MADVQIRTLRPDEVGRFVRSVLVPFLDPAGGGEDSDRRLDRFVRRVEPDRSWIVEDDGRFAANCTVHTMDVTLPASPGRPCPVIEMGGISAVGVHPTHRRRGYLRALMAEMLDDCRSRGEAVAGLIASESVIYGRFGFGLATDAATYRIDTREAAMLSPVPELKLRMLEPDEAAGILPGLFERQRRTRAGEPGRGPLAWEEYLSDEPYRRHHDGKRALVAACDDGYVAFRAVEETGSAGRARLVVEELRGIDSEVEAGLWGFVFGVDLIDSVTALRRPVDDPLRWRLADPRQLRLVGIEDRLHVRVLDVPAALQARGYRRDGRLVLDVVAPAVDGGPSDPVPGRWVLEAGPDGADCRPARAGEPAELRVDVTALGSLYMGGYPASLLLAAGRVEELTPGAAREADGLFGTWPAPLTGTGF